MDFNFSKKKMHMDFSKWRGREEKFKGGGNLSLSLFFVLKNMGIFLKRESGLHSHARQLVI